MSALIRKVFTLIRACTKGREGLPVCVLEKEDISAEDLSGKELLVCNSFFPSSKKRWAECIQAMNSIHTHLTGHRRGVIPPPKFKLPLNSSSKALVCVCNQRYLSSTKLSACFQTLSVITKVSRVLICFQDELFEASKFCLPPINRHMATWIFRCMHFL